MKAMVLHEVRTLLVLEKRPLPSPAPGEIRLAVEACAVCRTDLHVVDGDLPNPKLPIIPGHEIVGRIDALGDGVTGVCIGERVGIPWLGHTCGHCPYCTSGRENLCDEPLFTSYTRDGGFASHAVADAAYAFPLPDSGDPVARAPLLCAGLIGWRSLVAAGPGERIGIYGFGAAAHIITQVCTWQGRRVFAFTRSGDGAAQEFARSLGVVWAGGSDEPPPERLDAAIIFAPVGELVPVALRAVNKGGRVVCGGIHMSDIRSSPTVSCGRNGRSSRSPTSPAGTPVTFWPSPQRPGSGPKRCPIRWRPPMRPSPTCGPEGFRARRFWFRAAQ